MSAEFVNFGESLAPFEVSFAEAFIVSGGGGGESSFTTDETLTLENGVLSVNTADDVEQDNTLPITSAAVHTTVGNIEVLLATI